LTHADQKYAKLFTCTGALQEGGNKHGQLAPTGRWKTYQHCSKK